MASGIIEIMKKAALDAIDSSGPVSVVFGKVTKTNPIEIKLSPSLSLNSDMGVLVFSRNVTDYTTTVDVDWTTEPTSGGSGEASFSEHTHQLTGSKTITIHNGLKLNDNVILLKVQGGQKYVVLDKVGEIK